LDARLSLVHLASFSQAEGFSLGFWLIEIHYSSPRNPRQTGGWSKIGVTKEVAMAKESRPIRRIPGAAPGIEHDEITSLPSGGERARVTCIDYSPDNVQIREIDNLEEFLGRHRPEWAVVRWINVDGLSDMTVIHALATKYELHPLAVEDLLHIPQRPKVDSYGGDGSALRTRLFVIARILQAGEGALHSHQVSIFLGHTTLLTFREAESDVWDPIRQRIQAAGSRLRGNDASFLMHSLLDAILDRCFPILEAYGERMEEIEDRILESSSRDIINEIHQIKRDLLLLRRVAWPMREVISTLQREPHECVSDTTRVYLRDLYDHGIQIIDIIENYREMAADLTDTYMSSVSNRMNEIMKVLTIMGSIFIPLTFLAGVYGMNFRHFPELGQVWGYPAFWTVCVLAASAMILFFRRRRWL
jgi:magnesium transporter